MTLTSDDVTPNTLTLPDPEYFSGKLALVTGAASGLGAAVCKHLRKLDCQVLALDIDADQGHALSASCGAIFAECDVSNLDAWQAVAAQCETLGPLNFVHLNAGIQIAPPGAPLEEYQFESMLIDRYRRMMGVNVDGIVFGLQTLLPHMASASHIVVTSSLAGIVPYDIDPLYAMSKHAVAGLVRSLAQPFANKAITINAICPGGIDTAIIPHAQRTDIAQFMTPEHVADEVLALLKAQETGKTWAKVSRHKAAFIIRAPGDKGGKQKPASTPAKGP